MDAFDTIDAFDAMDAVDTQHRAASIQIVSRSKHRTASIPSIIYNDAN